MDFLNLLGLGSNKDEEILRAQKEAEDRAAIEEALAQNQPKKLPEVGPSQSDVLFNTLAGFTPGFPSAQASEPPKAAPSIIKSLEGPAPSVTLNSFKAPETEREPAADEPIGAEVDDSMNDFSSTDKIPSNLLSETDSEGYSFPSKGASARVIGPSGPIQGPPLPPVSRVPSEAASPSEVSRLVRNQKQPDDYEKEFESAKKMAAMNDLFAGLAHAGETISAGISRNKPNYEFSNQMAANADSPIKRLQAKQEGGLKAEELRSKKAHRNADSPESVAARKIVAMIKPELATDPEFNKMTAETAKEFLTGLTTAEKIEAYKAIREKTAEQKATSETDKSFTKLDEKLNLDLKARGVPAKVKESLLRLQRLKGLVGVDGDWKVESGKIQDTFNLDPIRMEELAMGVANVFGGGNAPARAQVEALVPQTKGKTTAKIIQWLSDEPYGTQQQAFVQQMVDIGKREEKQLQEQLDDMHYKAIGDSARLRNVDESRFDDVLARKGLSYSNYLQFLQRAKQQNERQYGHETPSTGGGLKIDLTPEQNSSFEAEMKRRGLKQ